MLPSFILALREGLEAALILGIVIGMLRKIGRNQMASAVWQGAAAAVLASLVGAILLNLAGARLEGRAEEMFEGTAMLLAAGILTWMIFWYQRQAHSLKTNLEADVKRASIGTGRGALFGLAFLAIGREGIELALFLTAVRVTAGGAATLVGALAGLLAAAGLGWMLFASTTRLNLKQFFLIMNLLLILFAAGLVAHGVHEFNEAGIIPSLVEHVWDINPVLDENSLGGELLKALFGYNGNPSLTEVLAYLAYFVLLLIRLLRAAPPAQRVQAGATR